MNPRLRVRDLLFALQQMRVRPARDSNVDAILTRAGRRTPSHSFFPRRGAGVAEQGCLLSSYPDKIGIGGSNPPLSATSIFPNMNDPISHSPLACRYFWKICGGVELSEAITEVLKGGSYVTPSAARGLDDISLREPKNREFAPEASARQREVIQLLAEGRTMKEIACRLHITPQTVAARKYAIIELLQLKASAEVVQYAIKHRIISV